MNRNKTIIAIIILIIDQITKLLVQLFNTDLKVIRNFLDIRYIQNTGAAWSILEGHSSILIIVSIIMLLLVINMMYSYEENRLNNMAFGILFGGILGNLCDRVFYGFVRDFIDINVLGYGFPVFNVADITIVIGVILILISTIKGERKNENRSKRKLSKNR